MTDNRQQSSATATPSTVNRGLHRFTLLVCGVAFVMISAGGMVTSMDAGDAVPDWPLSYGSLLPPMVGNVFYEHGHRMIGWLLGILIIAQTVWISRSDPRRWMRRCGIAALVGVCVLGGLGGLRVMTISNPAVQDVMMSFFGLFGVTAVGTARVCIAIVHTMLAQSFLCFLAFIALATSPAWITTQPGAADESAMRLRRLCWVTIGIILVQLLLGAIRRHTGTTMIPHAIGAAAVAAHVILIFRRVMISFAGVAALVKTSGLMLALLGIQLVLGLYSWLLAESVRGKSDVRPSILGSETIGSAVLTSHLAIGAGILLCTVLLTAWTHRLWGLATDPVQTPAAGRLATV